jgi:hypothetical protein
MWKKWILLAGVLSAGVNGLRAEDMGDGISEATDEPMSGEDKLGDKDINIRFIVVNALSQAKKGKSAANEKTNFNDGSGDNNENSVVLEPGSRADRIVNVVVEK